MVGGCLAVTIIAVINIIYFYVAPLKPEIWGGGLVWKILNLTPPYKLSVDDVNLPNLPGNLPVTASIAFVLTLGMELIRNVLTAG